MPKQEIERRFLISAMDRSVLKGPGKEIIQGYLKSPARMSVRVRVIDGKEAYLARKEGSGLVRSEEEIWTDLDTARFLLEACIDIVVKRRWLVMHRGQEWSVDIFSPPLDGLTIAEAEIERPDSPLELPPWIVDAAEVTDTLTSRKLARIATELSGISEPRALHEYFPRRLPRIVLTGGPGSGKTSVFKRLRAELGTKIHFVPEVASIVIGQIGVSPPLTDPVGTRRYNRLLSRIQRHFEEVADIQAHKDAKRAILTDRGVVDNAAYLPGGITDLEYILGTSRAREYSEYALVIILGLPPRSVYEAGLADNPVRYETYEQAIALSERIERAWSGHPNVRIIPAADSISGKISAVQNAIHTLLP